MSIQFTQTSVTEASADWGRFVIRISQSLEEFSFYLSIRADLLGDPSRISTGSGFASSGDAVEGAKLAARQYVARLRADWEARERSFRQVSAGVSVMDCGLLLYEFCLLEEHNWSYTVILRTSPTAKPVQIAFYNHLPSARLVEEAARTAALGFVRELEATIKEET